MTDPLDFTDENAFAEALKDATFRRAFNRDPHEALRGAGINPDGIDEKFLSAIAELSTNELRLVADIVQRIRDMSPIEFPF